MLGHAFLESVEHALAEFVCRGVAVGIAGALSGPVAVHMFATAVGILPTIRLKGQWETGALSFV